MLLSTHKNILISWSNLLQDFQEIISKEEVNFSQVLTQWKKIQKYLQETIVPIHCEDLPNQSQQTNWQTWQTETYRYVRLLNTEISFWQSSRQQETKNDRFLAIQERLTNMIQLTDKLLNTNE